MKYIKLFESMDVEDFDFIFQDIKDDFPQIKWTFNRELEEILSGFGPDSGNLDGYGMDLYDFGSHRYVYNENLLGYSNDMPYNPQNRFTDGIKKWHKEIKSLSNKLNPYFYEIKNRLREKGLIVSVNVRKSKHYGLFKFAITYKPFSKKFEGVSGDILGIKIEREEILIKDFVNSLRELEVSTDYVDEFLEMYDSGGIKNSWEYLAEPRINRDLEDWNFMFVDSTHKTEEYDAFTTTTIYQRKSDGKYFKYEVYYNGRKYQFMDKLVETTPRYITTTLWENMDHLKKFNEAIVDWETDNIKAFYEEAKDSLEKSRRIIKNITFIKLKEIGKKHNIEVVDYKTFYRNLPDDEMRKSAPPEGGIPFFGLCNPVTHKACLVVQISKLNLRELNFAYHMLKHENVHVGQKSRKKDKTSGEYLGDINNTKAYFSNKDEVMAFAQSVSDMVMGKNPETLEQAIMMINKTSLWRPIQSVDEKTKKRYKKYIYLYLEKEFEKRDRFKKLPK